VVSYVLEKHEWQPWHFLFCSKVFRIFRCFERRQAEIFGCSNISVTRYKVSFFKTSISFYSSFLKGSSVADTANTWLVLEFSTVARSIGKETREYSATPSITASRYIRLWGAPPTWEENSLPSPAKNQAFFSGFSSLLHVVCYSCRRLVRPWYLFVVFTDNQALEAFGATGLDPIQYSSEVAECGKSCMKLRQLMEDLEHMNEVNIDAFG